MNLETSPCNQVHQRHQISVKHFLHLLTVHAVQHFAAVRDHHNRIGPGLILLGRPPFPLSAVVLLSCDHEVVPH